MAATEAPIDERSDFAFGTLASEDERLEYVRARRLGVTCLGHAPRDPRPDQPVTVEISIGPDQPCEGAFLTWTNDGRDPGEGGDFVPMEEGEIEWDTLIWGYVRRLRATIPGQPQGTVVRYRAAAENAEGATFADEGRVYAYYVDAAGPPEWGRDMVVYHLFVDRFFPGEGREWQTPTEDAPFCGGRLAGVTEKLDYLTDLGVDALWLSPIFASPSYHGYDATDLFRIEPRLGTDDDLRALLDGAHARGMRVLLDFVPNHWSNRHPSFQAATTDPESPYHDWYVFTRWPDEYESFLNLVPTLPKLNLRHGPAREHVLSAAAHWLEVGADGYRVDHAIGPAPDFWADFRRVTRAARADCLSFGEATTTPEEQLALHGLDGCLDFLLLDAFRETFALGRWPGTRFAAFLNAHVRFFPANFVRPTFLENHDMNRFLWVAGGDQRRLKLAALCQFTLDAPPIVYYGTEVGLSQTRDVRETSDREARLPMLWGEEQDGSLLNYYRRLIALRRDEAALRRGELEIVAADTGTLAYSRGEELVVALNLEDAPRSVDLGPWGTAELDPLSGAVLKKGAQPWQP